MRIKRERKKISRIEIIEGVPTLVVSELLYNETVRRAQHTERQGHKRKGVVASGEDMFPQIVFDSSHFAQITLEAPHEDEAARKARRVEEQRVRSYKY